MGNCQNEALILAMHRHAKQSYDLESTSMASVIGM